VLTLAVQAPSSAFVGGLWGEPPNEFGARMENRLKRIGGVSREIEERRRTMLMKQLLHRILFLIVGWIVVGR
jgi:hypothetical protein